jgi:hypothetical protein
MAGIPTPFDWQSLITPAAAFGGKLLGDTLAPAPDLMQARTNQQTAQVNNEIAKEKMANANAIRGIALPGMLTNLGYSPDQGAQAASNYGFSASNPNPTYGPTGSTSTPGIGSKVGKTILGAGMTVAPAVAGSLLKSAAPALVRQAIQLPGAAAATAAAGTAVPATGITGALGLGGGAGLFGLGAATLPVLGGAALAADLIWKHTQVHPTADKWVQSAQNPFDAKWKQVEQAQQSGQISAQQAQQTKVQNAQNYLNALQSFAGQGSKNLTVAKQAATTFRKYYGDPSQYGVQLSF